MVKNKFRVGESVQYTSYSVGRPGASGSYTVVRILPMENGEQQYRIKSVSEMYERVAHESQLERRT